MTVGGMGFIPERLLMMMMMMIVHSTGAKRLPSQPHCSPQGQGLDVRDGGLALGAQEVRDRLRGLGVRV